MICTVDDRDCLYPEGYVPCEKCEIWRAFSGISL